MSWLVYLPAQQAAFPYVPATQWKSEQQGYNRHGFRGRDAGGSGRAAALAATTGALIARDPVTQQRWRVDFKGTMEWRPARHRGRAGFSGKFIERVRGTMRPSAPSCGPPMPRPGSSRHRSRTPSRRTICRGDGRLGRHLGAFAPGVLSEVAGPVRNISRLLVFAGGHGPPSSRTAARACCRLITSSDRQ
jgi:alcohol dehydrogenase (cytochrome c)/quinohemoprotein ethanol dehydrogenase